jgi:hypothetical protein
MKKKYKLLVVDVVVEVVVLVELVVDDVVELDVAILIHFNI